LSTAFALPVFFASLAVTLASAAFFARRLDTLGVHLGLPEALLGLLTALAADAPEITSALVALAKGAQGASFGVLIGSNLFNLAAMIGLTAVLVGNVRLRRESLLLEGSVGLLAGLVAAGLVAHLISAVAATLLLLAILAPYVFLLVRGRAAAVELPLPRRTTNLWKTAALIPPAIALIVTGSVGMVEAALALASTWHVSRFAIGVLVLAPLTSIPNAFTALRLGRAGRGSALVSETLNSNTINLVAGLAVPALFVSVARITHETKLDLAWLGAMTVVTLLLLSRRRGLGRSGGSALIGLYLVFLVVELSRL
jgi:cation:H+ antiporter